MKKILLPGLALLLAANVNAQTTKFKVPVTGVTNMAEKLAQRYAAGDRENERTSESKNAPQENKQVPAPEQIESAVAAVPNPTVQWKAIGGSMNVYGMLVSASKPLHYYDELNAVSFIHRKGNTYTSTPVDNSGSIVARISLNWGASWDSTCIWADANNLARYPQGGIYNPLNGNNINNAYIAGMGPVTDPSAGVGWKGNWYASKQLGSLNYNNTAASAPQTQFISNGPPYQSNLAKHDFSRYSFTSTDDGVIRSIAGRYDGKDINGQPTGFRGAAIIKGAFNSGSFIWTSDTIIPAVVTNSINGTKQLYSQPLMAWNEQGTHGYVVMIGAAATATGSNRGWQPIVYKTDNSGASWAPIAGIDFNDPSFNSLKYKIRSIGTGSLEIPFFKIDEGIDLTVDGSNKLHIVSTIVGTSSNHDDSLAYTWRVGANNYSWGHVPGDRPYIYDFVGDGSGPWTYITVDSLSTEGPGTASTSPGYSLNPWDADPAADYSKVPIDSRIQVGRTYHGQYLVYSWAESDTNFTDTYQKWNSLPNIKTRAAVSTPTSTILSPDKINLTRPPVPVIPTYTQNPQLSSRATFHYQSPKLKLEYCENGNKVILKVPFTITTSFTYSQKGENRHWYTTASLDFTGLPCIISAKENLAENIKGISVYPNPANQKATVSVEVKEEGEMQLDIYNISGQVVHSSEMNAKSGENKITLDLSEYSKGLYLVTVRTGNTVSTKRLIID